MPSVRALSLRPSLISSPPPARCSGELVVAASGFLALLGRRFILFPRRLVAEAPGPIVAAAGRPPPAIFSGEPLDQRDLLVLVIAVTLFLRRDLPRIDADRETLIGKFGVVSE